MRPRRVAGTVVAVVCVFLSSACTATISGSDPTVGPGNATSPTTLSWSSCRGSYQCASLEVPLNWSEPAGTKISLALIRKPATGGRAIGSLLLNPGGPGEPGTTFLTQLLTSGTFPEALSKRFDLVSWDPRGTGNSSGIACLTEAELTAPDPLPYPPTAAGRRKVEDQQLGIQKRCLTRYRTLVPHVGTIQTVHDLDAIRSALGDPKLNYVGFSYGTAIGLEYLRLFGSHVRTMVLDGIDLPGTDPIETTHAQMASFESNLDRFLADCKADSACAFGRGNPKNALLAFLGALEGGKRIPASYTLPDESGVSHTRDGTLGYTEAVTGIAAALYNQQSWSILRGALAAADRPGDPDGHVLLALRDLLAGRQLDGSWDHSSEARAAIACADQSERSASYFGDVSRIRSWKKELPVFGAFGASGLPGCYRWPRSLEPLTRLSRSDLANAPSIVLVNSEHDPATPYANATAAAALLPGSTLVTWTGDDHTSFAGGHRCIDDAIVPYLVSGILPPRGTRCRAPAH